MAVLAVEQAVTYYFLTAMRNESGTVGKFIEEFATVVEELGLHGRVVLAVVDDYSLDDSGERVRRLATGLHGFTVQVVTAPTNLGNQGAMFYGLQHLEIGRDDLLITFDCDGEDDVRAIPAIIQLARENSGKAVLIERARRRESALFKVLFSLYKQLFRRLTGNPVIPNNFMLLPGWLVPAIKRSALASAHFAYGILRLGVPYVSVAKDRRPRYAGGSSQNLFTLMSHGMVGLMVFFEVVLGKLFLLAFLAIVGAFVMLFAATAMPGAWPVARAMCLAGGVAAGAGGVVVVNLMLAAALALVFKVMVYQLHVGAVFRTPMARQADGSPAGGRPGDSAA